MGRELLYEDEVLLALAAVSLFEGAHPKTSNDGSPQPRWNSLSPTESFRLLNNVIHYEQLAFELYTCDALVKAERRSKLEDAARITRKRLVACLKRHPDIAERMVIHNEDRGAIRIPVRVTSMSETVQRLWRFNRFLRKSPGVELSSIVAVAKSVARIRSIFETRLPNQRVTSSSEDAGAEMHIEHNGVQAKFHPHVNPAYHPVSVSVSSSGKLNFSRHNNIEAIAVGLAALARGHYFSAKAGCTWESEDLNAIIRSGRTFFNDTVLLMRQLALQTGREDLTESQLNKMLSGLDEQMGLTQFNCRAIGGSREVDQWRGLKCRQTVKLNETTVEQAITNFFLTSKMALLVAKDSVIALLDGNIRAAVKVAADHHLTLYSNVSVSEVVKMVFRMSQGAAVLHVIDESPKADLIPRPIDPSEVATWSENEQCKYHDAIWCLLKDQERLTQRRVAGRRHRSEEHRAWQRVLQEISQARGEGATSDENSSIVVRQLRNGEPVKQQALEADEACGVDDDSMSSAASSASSFNNDGYSLKGTSSAYPAGKKSAAGPVGSGVAVVGSTVDRDSGEGRVTATAAYEPGVESIFSDEENRAPDAPAVLPDLPKNGASHRRLGEVSAKAAPGAGNGHSPKVPTSTSSDFRTGPRLRGRSVAAKNLLPGEAADAEVESEGKRAKRDSPRN